MRKRFLVLLLGLIGLLLCLSGCGGNNSSSTTEEAADETTTEEVTAEEVKSADLLIGQEGDYGRYYMLYTDELTPEKVVEAIADTTGWNLTLDREIQKQDNGYVICFAEESVFYTGQTLDESDEFYLPSNEDFYVTVLDSITRSIRRNFKDDGGSPDLYYRGADDTNLILTGIGKTLPKDVAYDHDSLESYTTRRYIGGDSAVSYDVEVTFVRMMDEETVMLEVEGTKQVYSVTYSALKTIFKNAAEGRQMNIQITEDTNTGEKLITKIYY